MSNYILSVVIPTKNRYEYLEPLIQLVRSFSCGAIEIVIEDNSEDNSAFIPVLNKIMSSDLYYYYNKESIPIGENLDNAIKHSTGEYVCVIGDDDGVLPSILKCVEWMKNNDVEAVIPMSVFYIWPDHDELTSNKKGVVQYTINNDKPLVEYLDPQQTLDDAIKNGFLDRGMLPICYHGIVRRKSLNKIYDIGSRFSPGPSPDIAAGVALSLVVKKYALINYPIIISGASRQHGGSAYRMKHGAAELDGLQFLPKNTALIWEDSLPKLWSLETIWPESAIKALRYMNREDLIERINYNRIYFEFLIRRFYYRKKLFAVIKRKASFILYFIPHFLTLASKFILRKLLPNKLNNKELEEECNVPTIVEAAEYINSLYPADVSFDDTATK